MPTPRAQGLGKHGFFTSEDLVRKAKTMGDDAFGGGIAATDSTAQAAFLPPCAI